MANIVYIACSLDGFIAREDGNLDWLTEIPNEAQSDYGFARFLSRVDAILMGRNTFETALGFSAWPYDKPVFVLSRTLKSVPASLSGRAEVVSGPLHQVLDRLAGRGVHNLYVDGGQTIQAFLKEGLIDELIVTTVAKLLGGGIPLFGALGTTLDFRVTNTEILNDHLVKTSYVRREPRANLATG